MLLRFRVQKVAVTADIQKASLQISITEHDRDARRSLVLKRTHAKQTTLLYKEVAYDASSVRHDCQSIPTRGNNTSLLEESENKDIAANLLSCFYVNDLLIGAAKVKNAQRLADDVEKLPREAGMELLRQNTNSYKR